MGPDGRWANDGGLLAYSHDVEDHSRRAVYIDKILKGDKPADLPVQAPRKFDLVINLKNSEADRCKHRAQRAGAGEQGHQITGAE